MPKSAKAGDIGTAILCIREIVHLTQKGLAALSGVHEVSICRYEQGNERASPRTIAKILDANGVQETDFAALVEAIGRVRKSMTEGGSTGRESRFVPGLPAGMSGLAEDIVALIDRRFQVAPPLEEVRRRAPSLLERLSRRPARDRALLLEECPHYRSWAIVELLCAKSLALAANLPDQALAQAELALEVARSIDGEALWQKRVEGFALVHFANAKRVGGFPREADAVFKKGKRLFEAGRAADPGIFEEALVLGLEASLRKDLRDLPEARLLIDRALAADTGQLRRELLTNKAIILKHLGEYDEAIRILEQVIPLLEEEKGSRLFCIVRLNVAATLVLAGRFGEAEEMLPRVRALVGALEQEIDLIRFRWLEGQLASVRGRKTEAVELLSGVREFFTREGISYDAALVTLELASVYLDLGRTGEVKRLVRELAPIFRSEGVHREALAALRLFCSAVEQETATAELARRIVSYLYRAEYNPALVFEA